MADASAIPQRSSARESRRLIGLVVAGLALSWVATDLLAQTAPTKERVSFPASTLVDPTIGVTGELRIPAGPGARLPAVVVIHNAGGLVDRTGEYYIEALQQTGFATLELDLYPRGGRPATTRLNLPQTFGSLIYLANHPRIDPARIGIMGFSWGGILALVSASSELDQSYTGGKYRFAAHLSLYPACWAHLAILDGTNKFYAPTTYGALTGAPVHILAGEKDGYDDPDSCSKFVQALPESVRRNVGVTIYPGVGHGWDTQEDRRYFDAVANKGRGGWVLHDRDRATAEKSRAFAVEFFRTNLGSK